MRVLMMSCALGMLPVSAMSQDPMLTAYEQLASVEAANPENLVGGLGEVKDEGTFPTIGYRVISPEAQFIPCEGDGAPLPAADVPGFLAACEMGFEMIARPVSADERAAAETKADDMMTHGEFIRVRWGDNACKTWPRGPFPLEGQTLKAFMDNKAACMIVYEKYWSVNQGTETLPPLGSQVDWD